MPGKSKKATRLEIARMERAAINLGNKHNNLISMESDFPHSLLFFEGGAEEDSEEEASEELEAF